MNKPTDHSPTDLQAALNAILQLQETFGDRTMSQIESELKGMINAPVEDIKEGAKPYYFEPEIDGDYWVIYDDADIMRNTYEADSYDHTRIEMGNCYRTKEQAQKALDKQKAIVFVNKLIDKANDGWEWVFGNDYYGIFHDKEFVYDATLDAVDSHGFRYDRWNSWDIPLMFIKSKDESVLVEIIENHSDKLKLIFDIED